MTKFKGTFEPKHTNKEYDLFWKHWAKNKHNLTEFSQMHNMCLYYFLKGLKVLRNEQNKRNC